jgi:hypothetical protein
MEDRIKGIIIVGEGQLFNPEMYVVEPSWTDDDFR